MTKISENGKKNPETRIERTKQLTIESAKKYKYESPDEKKVYFKEKYEQGRTRKR